MRECQTIEVDTSLPVDRVIQVLVHDYPNIDLDTIRSVIYQGYSD